MIDVNDGRSDLVTVGEPAIEGNVITITFFVVSDHQSHTRFRERDRAARRLHRLPCATPSLTQPVTVACR
jgi:hypothetical protein